MKSLTYLMEKRSNPSESGDGLLTTLAAVVVRWAEGGKCSPPSNVLFLLLE
jgi:hypothetical protein